MHPDRLTFPADLPADEDITRDAAEMADMVTDSPTTNAVQLLLSCEILAKCEVTYATMVRLVALMLEAVRLREARKRAPSRAN